MAEYVVIVDDNKEPSCLRDVTTLGGGSGAATNLGASVNTADPQNPVLTVTSSTGTDATVTIPIPASGGGAATNLGSTVDTSDPQNPVVTVTSSTGTDTSFTVPIPNASAGVTVSATPPAAPSDGAMWKSTTATVAPYSKNVLYSYNLATSRWEVVTGDARTERLSIVSNMAAGAFNTLSFSTSTDNTGGSSAASTFTVGATGLYDISLWVHPSSAHNWSGTAEYNGLLMRLKVDGTSVLDMNHTDYGNGNGSGVIRPASGTVNSVPLTAGQAVEVDMFILQGTFSGNVSLRIVRRV